MATLAETNGIGRLSAVNKAYWKYFAALLLFGTNGIVAGFIDMSSHEIVLLRTLTGSLFLLAVYLFSGRAGGAKWNRKDFAYIAVSGVATGASWMFLFEAYTRVGVSVATLAYYCGPVFVVVLTHFVFHERITWIRCAGFLIVLSGLYLVNQHELLYGGLSWGLACGLLSAVLYAVMVVFNRRAVNTTGLRNSLVQLMFSFATAAVFTLSRQGLSMEIPLRSILPVLVLGVVNTGAGCYLYFSSIPRLSAQTVALCGYLEPVSALVFSAIFLHERLTAVQLAGTALILGGAVFGEFVKLRKRCA